MSKYTPLKQRLTRSGGAPVQLTFAEIEKILGFPLPRSARRYAAWWSNSGGSHVQSLAWMEAGYRTQDIKLREESVRFLPSTKEGLGEMPQAGFEHSEKPQQQPTEPEVAKQPSRHPAFGVWKGLVTLDPDYDYTQPADPDWGKVYED